MANLATSMATMLSKGKHSSVLRTPTWSSIAIANSPREASATRRITRSRVLLLRSFSPGCDHKVSLSRQTTQTVLLAYVFVLPGEGINLLTRSKYLRGNLVSLRATFPVCVRERDHYGVYCFMVSKTCESLYSLMTLLWEAE